MKITKVEIRNWRSIKDIEFFPSTITILVGANNAGKTNVLSAINFLLGDRWPMPANLDESDHFASDRRRPIYIKLHLNHPRYGSIEFDMRREAYVLQAYRPDGTSIRGFNNEQRDEIAFAYVDAARSFDRQFSVSRWSLFGQAMKRLHEAFIRGDGDLARLKGVLAEAHALLRTDTYVAFELALRQAFSSQLQTAGYDISFEFRTVDETNLYRSLFPTFLERERPRAPPEVGSGVRNLLVLALFNAFAEAFRGGAVLGVEEPELYLHPHAQRSLMARFEALADAGNQLFISTHSTAFLDVTRSHRIVLVDRSPDAEEEVCSQVRTTTPEALVAIRRRLHPNRQITAATLEAYLRNVRTVEMAEPYFARLVVLVEGASEREALPIFAKHLGLDVDGRGVSIVAAGGKTVIDTLRDLYVAHGIPIFIIFDNDEGVRADDRAYNLTLCRMLGIAESDAPAPRVEENFAILRGDWEKQLAFDLEGVEPGLYSRLEGAARIELGLSQGKGKPLVARHVAAALTNLNHIPLTIVAIVEAIRAKLG